MSEMHAIESDLVQHYAAVRRRLTGGVEPVRAEPNRRTVAIPLRRREQIDERLLPRIRSSAEERAARRIAMIELRNRLMGNELPIPKSWREIVVEVAAKHNVSVLEILSVRRNKPIVRARQEACWRMKMETTMSLPKIGLRLGGRDHTTVLHSIRRHAALVAAGEAV